MKPSRLISIRRNIASVLDNCAPMLVPEVQLLRELNFQLQPPATLSEFEHVIGRMEEARQIIRHPVQDEGIKTKLTPLGEAELLT